MKVAKLFAYLAVCLLLPWWLYTLTTNDAKKEKLQETIDQLKAKLDGEQESAITTSREDLIKSQNDLVEAQKELVNSQKITDASLQQLIQVSSTNAATWQGIPARYQVSFDAPELAKLLKEIKDTLPQMKMTLGQNAETFKEILSRDTVLLGEIRTTVNSIKNSGINNTITGRHSDQNNESESLVSIIKSIVDKLNDIIDITFSY